MSATISLSDERVVNVKVRWDVLAEGAYWIGKNTTGSAVEWYGSFNKGSSMGGAYGFVTVTLPAGDYTVANDAGYIKLYVFNKTGAIQTQRPVDLTLPVAA